MLRRLTMLVATFAVAGLAAGVAAAGVTTHSVNQTTPIQVFVPCANGGAGELVSGTYNRHLLITATVNDNTVSGTFHAQPQGTDLVGETSGDVYQGTGVSQETFSGSLQNGQYTDTFVENFRIIGPGRGNNFLLHEVGHVTVNANGDVTVEFDKLSEECK